MGQFHHLTKTVFQYGLQYGILFGDWMAMKAFQENNKLRYGQAACFWLIAFIDGAGPTNDQTSAGCNCPWNKHKLQVETGLLKHVKRPTSTCQCSGGFWDGYTTGVLLTDLFASGPHTTLPYSGEDHRPWSYPNVLTMEGAKSEQKKATLLSKAQPLEDLRKHLISSLRNTVPQWKVKEMQITTTYFHFLI